MIRTKRAALNILPMVLLFLIWHVRAATIKADDPNFQYTGRIDFSQPDTPALYWPGSQIRANFEGAILIILLDDANGQSHYNVFVDNDYEHPFLIHCRKGSQRYVVASTLADTAHSLLVFRRTEASTGPTRFLGIELGAGKALLAPPARLERKILFYGDSITCGMGNEALDTSGDDNMAEENNFLAYGAIASRLLGAEYMCIAKSGIGIMISWFDMVMSQYYYRLDPDNPESRWDYSKFTPEVVVINLFQNDSWLYTNLKPVPSAAEITNAYVNFVREIRFRHPKAFIVCTLGSMDATRTGSPWPGYITRAVETLRDADKDTNLTTFFFPYENWSKHPRIRHHQEMGKKLAAFVSDKMGWKSVDSW